MYEEIVTHFRGPDAQSTAMQMIQDRGRVTSRTRQGEARHRNAEVRPVAAEFLPQRCLEAKQLTVWCVPARWRINSPLEAHKARAYRNRAFEESLTG